MAASRNNLLRSPVGSVAGVQQHPGQHIKGGCQYLRITGAPRHDQCVFEIGQRPFIVALAGEDCPQRVERGRMMAVQVEFLAEQEEFFVQCYRTR